ELELPELLEPLELPELAEPLPLEPLPEELLPDELPLPEDEPLPDEELCELDCELLAGVAARYITERTSSSILRSTALARSARSTSSCPAVEYRQYRLRPL